MIGDWYEIELQHDFGNVILKGIADYLVATGADIPETPFFFLQEFKYSLPDKDPKYQLLAEMLVAIAQNKMEEVKGAYVIGQLWYFTLLKKKGEQYEYYISPPFNALSVTQLQQIYRYLQAVKADSLSFLHEKI